jgi:pSer/pThr/pTyr-binding forkhead associated (FHA) protein
MQVVLAMFLQDGERRSFSIVRDMTVVGRREDCDLRIPLGDVSRKHCRLIKDGDAIRVEDLGSSNGTYHNGQRIQEAILMAGDSVKVGPVTFVVQIDGFPPDDDLKPGMSSSKDAASEGEPLDIDAVLAADSSAGIDALPPEVAAAEDAAERDADNSDRRTQRAHAGSADEDEDEFDLIDVDEEKTETA